MRGISLQYNIFHQHSIHLSSSLFLEWSSILCSTRVIAINVISSFHSLICLFSFAGVILFNESLLKQFTEFRERTDTFTLGVCNGCQLMALLGECFIRLFSYLLAVRSSAVVLLLLLVLGVTSRLLFSSLPPSFYNLPSIPLLSSMVRCDDKIFDVSKDLLQACDRCSFTFDC